MIFHQTVRGVSHIKYNIPCEDASDSFTGDGFSCIAVADGHGDPNCFRANRGSRIAVDAAISRLREFASAQQTLPTQEDICRLEQDIVACWKHMVLDDFTKHQPADEELVGTRMDLREFVKTYRPEYAYGCTLLAALETKEYTLMLQLGDGRIITVSSDGTGITEPVPWDDRCWGRRTTSLCHGMATDFRHLLIDHAEAEAPLAVILISDGVEDAFANSEDRGLYCACLAVELAEEQDQVDLAEELEALSQISLDDASIACIVDPAISSMKSELFFKQERRAVELSVLEGRDKAQSLGCCLRAMEQKLECARENVARKAKNRTRFFKDMMNIMLEYDAAVQELQGTKIEHKRVAEELTQCKEDLQRNEARQQQLNRSLEEARIDSENREGTEN